MPVDASGGNEGGLPLSQIKEEASPKQRTPFKKPAAVPPVKNAVVDQGLPAHGLVHPETPSTSATAAPKRAKVEESEEDFAYGDPPLKKFKSETCPEGKPVKYAANAKLDEDHKMNWDIVQVERPFPFVTNLVGVLGKESFVDWGINLVSVAY